MRLLKWTDHGELSLTDNLDDDNIPPYAILSHTWGAVRDEVSFSDLQDKSGHYRTKAGYRKIEFCGKQAQTDGISHFWVDTCCIDKSNHVELSEAITSMFRWYHRAEICYVYLSTVSARGSDGDSHAQPAYIPSFRASPWFTRGWTLQELLAPSIVEFYARNGDLLGTKATLVQEIHKITTIPVAALQGVSLLEFTIAERIRWVQKRKTTKKEDKAYCLQGIFDVHMPLIYGEGDNALRRLQKEINEKHGANVAVTLTNNYASNSLGSYPTSASADATETDYETLLKSLLFDRIDARVHNIRKPLSKTCEWLFQHTKFQAWHTARNVGDHNGFLWIKGKPGCGKSTIMKTALDWARMETTKQSTDQITLNYFFNARASATLEKSSLGLYRSLTYQLLCAYPSSRSLFTNRFVLRSPDSASDTWTREELQNFLSDVLISADVPLLYLFIDALDECEHEDDMREMVDYLVDLSETASEGDSPGQLRICLSSRPFPHISIRKTLSLVVEDQPEHHRDMHVYIRKKLTGLEGKSKDELIDEIGFKSKGIFLWVVLVVNMLNKNYDNGDQLAGMRVHLDNIPEGLNKLFEDILTKSVGGIEDSIACFRWVLFSRRNLEPQELYLAIHHSRAPWDATFTVQHMIEVPAHDHLARYILNCSRGLVEVTLTHPPKVQFIHETVRDFLINQNGLAPLLPTSTVNLESISHEILKIGCLRYISACKSSTDVEQKIIEDETDGYDFTSRSDRLQNIMPLLQYAILYIYWHAEHAGVPQEVFLRSRIDGDGRWKCSDRRLWNAFVAGYKKGVTLLYVVAHQGYLNLCSTLLKVSGSVNIQCGTHGNALQAACHAGHEQIVRLLITNGAYVNAIGGIYKHVLLTSIYARNFALVPVLKEYGAHLDPPLLNHAIPGLARNGSVQSVRMLLELGADVNAQNQRYGTALRAATLGNHGRVVKILLEAGADANAGGDSPGSPLQIAVRMCHRNIEKMLRKYGAKRPT